MKSASRQPEPFENCTRKACAEPAGGAASHARIRHQGKACSNGGMTPAPLRWALSKTPQKPAPPFSTGTKASAATVGKISPTDTPFGLAASFTHHHHGRRSGVNLPSRNTGESAMLVSGSIPNSYGSVFGTSIIRYRFGRSAICRTCSGWNTSNWATSLHAAIAAMHSRPSRKHLTGQSLMPRPRQQKSRNTSRNSRAEAFSSVRRAPVMASPRGDQHQ